MLKKRVAIIGYGAIARDVIAALPDACGDYVLAVLHRRVVDHIEQRGVLNFLNIEELKEWQPDIVIEAAGHEVVRTVAPQFLSFGVPVLVSSVGALHDHSLFENLTMKAEQGKTRLLLPSGAIGALDYVRACRFTKEQIINYESRKPVKAWRKELLEMGIEPEQMVNPVILFEGTAREAAKLYPANLNVAATLALAGIGMDDTRVCVVADPSLSKNQHHIHVKSDHGTMQVSFENTVSAENPKSSRIVAKSIVAAVQQYFLPYQFL